MSFLKIGVNNYNKEFLDDLSKNLNKLSEVKYSINEYDMDEFSFITYTFVNETKDGRKLYGEDKTCKIQVSKLLADLIIKNYEEKLVKKIIHINYRYFNINERKDILDSTIQLLKREENDFLGCIYKIRRRNLILKQLIDYFSNWDNIIIDGFIKFRLKDYVNDLEELVEQAVEDFLTNREYKEFLSLLKYFVEIQESKVNTIHIIPSVDGNHTLIDEVGDNIITKYFSDINLELFRFEENDKDMLISTLITMAPKTIVIHNNEFYHEDEIYDTISSVFSGRCSFCGSCDICKTNQ